MKLQLIFFLAGTKPLGYLRGSTVSLRPGQTINYDSLLDGTGSKVRDVWVDRKSFVNVIINDRYDSRTTRVVKDIRSRD